MWQLFSRRSKRSEEFDPQNVPQHIGIIMDGNGRWAKKRGLPRTAGHKTGANTFKNVVHYCKDLGVKYLTVYAFSTENWKRPQEEVDAIMDLLRSYLSDAFSNPEDGVKVVVIGDREPLADDIKQQIIKLEEESVKTETVMTLNIALNYGGRLELVQAMQKIANKVKEGSLAAEDISEQLISDMIYTAGQPDPDLIIRPSGEFRTSNFLLWQSAYSELVFMDVLWPDFTKEDLVQAIIQYQKRNRRFGGV